MYHLLPPKKKKKKSALKRPALRDVLKGLLSSVFMKAWESILPKSFIKTAFHILQTCVCVCVCVRGGGIKCPHFFSALAVIESRSG